MLAANDMSNDPFMELPVDGIVGLSMEGLCPWLQRARSVS